MADPIFQPSTIALLGFGEAGSAIAEGLCTAGGWRDGAPGRQVISIDIALDRDKRGVAMRARAESLGVPITADYTDALSTAELVISVVTGTEAHNAARMARPLLAAGTLYADVNTITGPETRTVAEELVPSGIDFVDVAAVGIFKVTGLSTPALLAGPRAAELAGFAGAIGMPVTILSDRIGDASAVKILRSVLMKGLEALSVECLVAARRQGLVSEVLDTLGDIDAMGTAAFIRALTITHLVHAKRRKEEMVKAAHNLVETGVPPGMTDAVRRNHQRTIDAALDPADMADLDLDAALEVLDEQVVGGSGSSSSSG